MAQVTLLDSRSDVKVLDCTIRDGGLINSHLFDDEVVRGVYHACVEGGVDYMEVGYKGDKKIFARNKFGDWKFSDEDSIRRIVGDNPTDLKLSVMADAEKTDYRTDILPREQSVIDLIRVATYIHQIPTAINMIKDAKDKGYEVCVNLMAISIVKDKELLEALEIFSQSEAETIVIVDSFGTLMGEHIRDLAKKYLKAARATGKEVGFHGHNNLQLGFSNTLEAMFAGVTRLDATIFGMGRGAGNCPLELLISFIKNPKYQLRPILKCIEDHFLKLRTEMEWGYMIPYLVTAHLNRHPSAAIEWLDSPERDQFVKFYDKLNEA